MVELLTEPQATEQRVARDIRRYLMTLKQEHGDPSYRTILGVAVNGIEMAYQLDPIIQVSEELWDKIMANAASAQSEYDREQASRTKTQSTRPAKLSSSTRKKAAKKRSSPRSRTRKKKSSSKSTT